MSTLSINTSKHQATSAPRARTDRARNGKPAGAARVQPRPAPRSSEAVDVDIRRLLQRLGRRWVSGGSPETRGIIEAVRPYLDKLKETERAVSKASHGARLATGRVTILESSVAKHRRHRDQLVQQVLHSRHEASAQKSSSRGAALRRTSTEWEQELRAYDEKFGGRPNELAEARSDARKKQVELRLQKKRVSQLGAAISQLLSPVTRPTGGVGECGSGNRARAAAVGGAVSKSNPPPEDRHASPHLQEERPAARVRAEQAAGRGRHGKTNDRQARQIGPPARTARGGVARDRRR